MLIQEDSAQISSFLFCFKNLEYDTVKTEEHYLFYILKTRI